MSAVVSAFCKKSAWSGWRSEHPSFTEQVKLCLVCLDQANQDKLVPDVGFDGFEVSGKNLGYSGMAGRRKTLRPEARTRRPDVAPWNKAGDIKTLSP